MTLLETPWGLMTIAFATAIFWRAAGAVLSGRIEVDTPLFDWCICVTQAIVGGLMVRAILMPTSNLALVPMTDRVGATLLGIAAFFVFRRQVLPSVLAGALCVAALVLIRSSQI
jgi:hypothetical protein